jgi:hypothetical protein
MSLKDILLNGGGLLLLLMTIIQITPIKLNPWSAVAKWLGKSINADVLSKLKDVEDEQKETRQVLDEHIRLDDERNADSHRQRILAFNNELLRDIPHTQEDFIEILAEIDYYEDYCKKHPEYKNNRAVHAVAHIGRVYDDRLQKHDFL